MNSGLYAVSKNQTTVPDLKLNSQRPNSSSALLLISKTKETNLNNQLCDGENCSFFKFFAQSSVTGYFTGRDHTINEIVIIQRKQLDFNVI